MYHSRYAELTANISSRCCQTDWAIAFGCDDETTIRRFPSGPAKACGDRLAVVARRVRAHGSGDRPCLAAASLTAAAVPRSTHAKRNRVIAWPLVGLGAHECLGDDPMARASKTRQNADEREATPGVGRLSLRPEAHLPSPSMC